MDDGIFLKSEDGGVNWMEYTTGISEYFFDMTFYNNDIGFAVGGNGTIIKTTNGGEEWTLLSSGISNDLFSISMPSLNTIWVVGDNGTVLNSTDQGDTWVIDNTMSSEKFNSISFRDADIGFIAGNNGTLFHTLNGGNTWNESNINTNDNLSSLSSTANFSFLLAGGNTGFKTSNNIDWVDFSLPVFYTSKLYFHNDNLGFTSEIIVFMCDCIQLSINKSINSGENWEEEYCLFETTITSNQLPLSGYSDIDFVSNEIGFVLSGRIVLRVSDCGTTTILNTSDFKYSNKHFTIYPNPSNSTNFNIDFNSTSTDNLSIDILDIQGRKIISEDELYNRISIDISSFNNGIYFVTFFENGIMIATEKLIVKK